MMMMKMMMVQVKIAEAGGGNLVAEMKVEKEHANSRNVMHGAMTTLLVDSLSGE
jgi:acyl-coenzyme A thioesterase PaaI-like protein